ncbi:MAG: HD domain-containing protein [Ktedonobacterales bacterium]
MPMTKDSGLLPPAGRIAPVSGRRAGSPMTIVDSLYGTVKVSAWASALLATPPFIRLAGVSLSSVPGELLFGRAFPSRLDHAIGVYHLARVARPRDRVLQLAALAHDLGHGPFSHLCEPLMIERLGEDHELRSISLLQNVRAALPESAQRRLDWLDWDEVASLMRGEGRGVLLNGDLDYDNSDNVARFKLHAGFGWPEYDPRQLVRGLRLLPGAEEPGRAEGEHAAPAVALQSTAEVQGLAWQRDRAQIYRFLHGDDGGHANLAVHAMLRKALDLAGVTDILPDDFFDLTDGEALSVLGQALNRGLLALVQRVEGGRDRWHRCIWEGETDAEAPVIPAHLVRAEKRLQLEAELAAEAGLASHEVILDALVSNAFRPLPPVWLPSGHLGEPNAELRLPTPPRVLHLFIGVGYGSDYVRRLCQAAERRFGKLGISHRDAPSEVES